VVIEVFVKHIIPLRNGQFTQRMRLVIIAVNFAQLLRFFEYNQRAFFLFFKIADIVCQKYESGSAVLFVRLLPTTAFFFYKSTQHQTHEYVGLRMVAVVRYVTVGQHSPHSGGVVGVNALIRPMTSSDTDLVKIFFIGYYLRNLTP
jgi:hypothetical protein